MALVAVPEQARGFLSAATRQSCERGETLILTTENWQDYANQHFGVSVSQKIERLLSWLGERCGNPGGAAKIDPEFDYPMINARAPHELLAYLRHMKESGLVDWQMTMAGPQHVGLTIPGWERLEPNRQPGGELGTCFVAMWFHQSMNEVYDLGILPAIETDCGLKAVRIDRKEHNNQITDEIKAEIRSAEFTVADFTGQRAGVYYEAGFASGLGRTVIYCCRNDDIGKVHFDTSVINHIVWTDPADLRKKLADRIKATILPKA